MCLLVFPCRTPLLRLHPFPVQQHSCGVVGSYVSEHVRMPAHHLVVNRSRDVVDSEFTTFLCYLCVEDYLKQQITEFVAEFSRPAFARIFDGLKSLVSLLEKHRRKRGVSLFAVPGTAVWRAQSIHQGYQIIECGR